MRAREAPVALDAHRRVPDGRRSRSWQRKVVLHVVAYGERRRQHVGVRAGEAHRRPPEETRQHDHVEQLAAKERQQSHHDIEKRISKFLREQR